MNIKITTVSFQAELHGAIRVNNRIIKIFSFFPFFKYKQKNKLYYTRPQ